MLFLSAAAQFAMANATMEHREIDKMKRILALAVAAAFGAPAHAAGKLADRDPTKNIADIRKVHLPGSAVKYH